ncbi:SigB/SigF/SigG family RNA polymerase sigma factor [Streptomyces sp. NPDC017529]|uniref:SigB/SigF/SigG family RNA polymerase sigma factor n=1 Tax=Streptomyces sp. NPDC017529 TaxID=3365000 RepID=UPI0037912CD9
MPQTESVADAPADALPGAAPAGLPRPADVRAITPQDARELTPVLFERLSALPEGGPEHQYARNCLVEMNLSLVHYAARRFRGRAADMEDMVQVGTVGLIKAIDRFEPARGVRFSAFAIPYVVGEIKRFFRDTSWAVHVPRRLQELRIDLARAGEKLAHDLNRAPTPAELAQYLELDREEVVEGLYACNGYAADSLDAPAEEDDVRPSGGAVAARLGHEDPGLEKAENVQALKPLLDGLEERDRRILHMRFGEEMTQTQIGTALGLSQMQVSRLLARILASLRAGMLEEN